MLTRKESLILLDCTLRDGGYYNDWTFPLDVINSYLFAMKAARIDVVELGFRFLKNQGFKGPCAFTTDEFVRELDIPPGLNIGVMVNGADLCTEIGWAAAMEQLFPESSNTTPVSLVRFACHFHELPNALSAASWLVDRGYRVGLNLMQIADRTQTEVEELSKLASQSAIEVLYFADSMGSMTSEDVTRVIRWLRTHWSGALGIHTHDNLRLALANTLHAHEEGVTWLDATVTGMGRGPGNACMEELLIEAEALRGHRINLVPLMSLIRSFFGPMKKQHGWGVNSYYYLAGKYGVHPSYIQEMLSDERYGEEDILAVLDYLREEDGKSFSFKKLDGALQFYSGEPIGAWAPAVIIKDRDVLILGTGPSVAAHRVAIENYIRRAKPIVLALNTESAINNKLIDLRVACHPVRLLADAETYATLPQPLITPASMLPKTLRTELSGKELLDFGLVVRAGEYSFYETFCVAPSSLVIAYALAIVTSGGAKSTLMAGFDGFEKGDVRNDEVETLLTAFSESDASVEIFSITPTNYKNLRSKSVYAI